MTKRAIVAILIGLVAALTIPSVALGQDQGSSGEGEATDPETTTTEPATEEEVVTEEASGEEAAVEEVATVETEEAEVEPQVATTDGSDSSATAAAAQTASDASVTTGTTTIRRTNGKKAKSSSRRGKKSGKSCSASSSAGGPVAQASAPVAAGCTRLNGPNGPLVLPDGTTLTITETSQGVISFTVSGGPTGTFTGTIFVKGGPSDPGNACVFTTPVTGGVCNAPVNPNNGKFFGVSHVDACPGTFVQPGPQPDSGRRDDDDRGGQREEEREREEAARRARNVPVAAAAVAAPGGQLPVTGLPVAWLVLVGGGLIASGFTLRRLT